MTEEIISVPEIHCGHCKSSIEGALQPLDGVQTASVNIPNTTVAVTYDPDTISRAQLVAAIEEQGYEVAAS